MELSPTEVKQSEKLYHFKKIRLIGVYRVSVMCSLHNDIHYVYIHMKSIALFYRFYLQQCLSLPGTATTRLYVVVSLSRPWGPYPTDPHCKFHVNLYFFVLCISLYKHIVFSCYQLSNSCLSSILFLNRCVYVWIHVSFIEPFSLYMFD